MTSSYQHSHPGHQLDVDIASADENDPLYSSGIRRPVAWKNRRVLAVTALGLACLTAFVTLVSHVTHSITPAFLIEGDAVGPPDYTSKEGQYDWQKCMGSADPDCWTKEGERVGHWWETQLVPKKTTTATLLEADASGPAPDYTSKEGQYDWQKCKESNDPDCWKNEGKRVGHWWENFGQRMRNFWSSLFGGKKQSTEESTTREPAAEKKEEEEPIAEEKAESAEDEITEEEPVAVEKTKAKKHKKSEEAVEEPKS